MEDQETKKPKKQQFIILIVVIIVAVYIFIQWNKVFTFQDPNRNINKKKSTQNNEKSIQNKSLEYKLALIDAGYYVDEDDITINRFRTLLNLLSNKYVENHQEISDMSVTTQKMLKDKGIKESILNIMEGMNKIFKSEIENQEYAEYAVAYVTLRADGQSHEEAIQGLRALMQDLGVY